jgi:hypothetical protein
MLGIVIDADQYVAIFNLDKLALISGHCLRLKLLAGRPLLAHAAPPDRRAPTSRHRRCGQAGSQNAATSLFVNYLKMMVPLM